MTGLIRLLLIFRSPSRSLDLHFEEMPRFVLRPQIHFILVEVVALVDASEIRVSSLLGGLHRQNRLFESRNISTAFLIHSDSILVDGHRGRLAVLLRRLGRSVHLRGRLDRREFEVSHGEVVAAEACESSWTRFLSGENTSLFGLFPVHVS